MHILYQNNVKSPFSRKLLLLYRDYLHITGRVGDYVTSKELLESLEKFADYMGDIILNSISIIAKDEFVVKI